MTLRPPRATGTTLRFADGEVLRFDAVLAEAPRHPGRASQHPTESGRPITSNVRLELVRVSLRAQFSDTPVGGGGDRVPGAQRANRLYKRLLRARAERSVVTLVSAQLPIPSLVVTTVEAPRSPATGLRVSVSITLEEVRLAEPVGTDVIPERILERLRPRRVPPSDPGKRTGTRAEDAPGRASIAKQATDNLFSSGVIAALSGES